jgi:hypothetical protein
LVYFRNSHSQGNADAQFIYGNPGDRFVAGDWNADGGSSPALFRPSSTTFYFRYTNTQGNADEQSTWGAAGWLPVSGLLGTLQLPPGIETVEQFLANFETAFRTGNGPWLYSRIHPVILDEFGVDACQAYWDVWVFGDPTARIELLSKSSPTLWRTDVISGTLMNVPNTYTITTRNTREGIIETNTWHLGLVGDKLNFFPVYCSD